MSEIASLSVSQIKDLFDSADPSDLPGLIRSASKDQRAGARALAAAAARRIDRDEARIADFEHRCSLERRLASAGFTIIAGCDEAGRGALAGPVVAAAVALDLSRDLSPLIDVKDSKQLSPEERSRLYDVVLQAAAATAVSIVSAGDIDRDGIAPANRRALEQAVADLTPPPDYVISDAFPIHSSMPALALVKGDARSIAVAAASIIAKVSRDRLMDEMAARYPGYNLDGNKGYSTGEHMEAIQRLGPTEIHRLSFAPCSGTQLSLI